MCGGRPVGHGSSIPPHPPPAVQRGIPTIVVTFDVGQVLVELDLDFLAQRVGERGSAVTPAGLAAAAPAAWAHYDQLVEGGAAHPWHALIATMLEGAGLSEVGSVVDWLWSEQPHKNLWRKPILPMLEIARELADHGVPTAIISNSEGRVAELLAEIGIADVFGTIVDSGRIGIAKPDRRIFEHALAALGTPDAAAIHIGDLWAADVTGALGAGWRAIWYGRTANAVDNPRIACARDPIEVRSALARWGAL